MTKELGGHKPSKRESEHETRDFAELTVFQYIKNDMIATARRNHIWGNVYRAFNFTNLSRFVPVVPSLLYNCTRSLSKPGLEARGWVASPSHTTASSSMSNNRVILCSRSREWEAFPRRVGLS
jgi:hypothetical protein